MKHSQAALLLILTLILTLYPFTEPQAQNVKDFFYAEPETKNLPVFVRGNLEAKKILLFIQGGGAERGIDFGRSDYPFWKNTLEKEVAIAYFDQRGLNRSLKKIDTLKINPTQVTKDIITIAKTLHKKYNAAIYLFGHSNGGQDVLDCLAKFPDETSFIKAGIAFNPPITTDFSPERYKYYRPLYLKNLAQEFIAQKKDTVYWKQALEWITEKDSLYDRETIMQWKKYTNNAYKSVERKISVGMALKVIFSRPYNPIKYLNNKPSKYISNKLWEFNKNLNRWAYLPNIKHRLLLITGRYDNIAVPEELEEAHKLIPNSELIIIPNSKHWTLLDQPQQFNNAVLNFLKNTD
ncbi:alpha/beta hydrolase [Flavobacterium litorale]|uniref:Alpha/beta hydrolase n=1 Tax=Flavobacterium litorale TaxID=2856519 RepID=A0ABX8V6V5_9FLAO|nr:alpha/beta hydrolase [Flavobacterium litorale]QYJ68487.1 alpha/beta hydrolase [Flavobacterium litorale]